MQDAALKMDNTRLSSGPFILEINPLQDVVNDIGIRFSMDAPTTSTNAMRLLRAMQLTKPILLEGSPGVGKTALVSALAKTVGYPLTRINLSEQTGMSIAFSIQIFERIISFLFLECY